MTGPATGSTAHVAALLGAPVILVVDAKGQSHSMAALLHGFSTFDDSTRIAGVILNRVGSPRHAEVLRQACEHAGIPVLGVLPRLDQLSVPSRHLGLITAVEHGDRARDAVDAMTALVASHVDLAGVVAAAGGCVAAEPWSPEHAIAFRADEPRHRRAGGGTGVQLLVRRAPRTAARGGCRRRRVRPPDRAACPRHRGGCAARRIPRGVRRRTFRQ